MKTLLVVVVLLGAAVVATFVRYESLDPCDWIMRDFGEASGLPPLVAQARMRAGFLMQGITEPTAYDCLMEWWRRRSEISPAAP